MNDETKVWRDCGELESIAIDGLTERSTFHPNDRRVFCQDGVH